MRNSDNLINSAVLVPIYRDSNNRLRLVCIRRSLGGIHGGELAFPGGKNEPADNSMLSTALRETQEEIGLGPDHIHILAELPPVETKTTGFRIFPFLGSIKPADWAIDQHEVAEVIDFDLETLADPAMYGEEVREYDNWPAPRLMAFYRVGDFKLWGASFRILHPLLPRILADEWRLQPFKTLS
ncbi:MAG: CoA pyrophosphatase [Desulfobulbaceae bacterium]|nr:CoA pyrophosphatase [Desulfobulbaceae bacterium]